MKKIFSHIDFKIAIIYFLFSALWIFFSDQIVHLIAPDLHTVTEFQTAKGWFFITVSSLLIYYFLHLFIRKERKVIEQLRVNEEKFRSIYEMSHDAILLTSPSDGRILSANPAACRILGRTEEEICLLGRSGIVDLTDSRLNQALHDRNEQGYYLTGLRFIRKDETIIECEVSSTIFSTAEGEQLSSMIIREVTDRVRAEQELQESEEKFSALFMKSAFAASLAAEADGRLIEINEKFVEVFGFSREEAIGKTSVELNINRDVELRKEMFAELREKGYVGTRKIELFKKTGEKRIMSVNIHLITIRGKRFILNTTQDITDQERVLDELQRSENDLKKAQRFAHLGSWTWTIPTNHIEWSDEMFAIFGVDKSTFTGSLNEIIESSIYPDDREAVEAANARIINKQEPIPLVYRIVTGDQIKTVWAEAGELILDRNGNPYKLSGIVQDITERISTEEKINLQANALEAAANAIVITDTKGVISWANSAFSQLTGYSESEYCGKSLRILNSGRQSGDFFADMWKTILAGDTWHGEVINKHKDGHYFFEEQTITPIRNSAGKISHFVGIKQDITQRKEAEIRIRNLLIESQQRMERLQTLRDIDFAINANRYLPDTLDIVLSKVQDQLAVDGVVVLLFQEASNIFTYGGSLGLTSPRIKNSRVKLGESLAGLAALQKKIVQLHDENRPVDAYFQSLLDEEQIVDYYGAPMIAKGKIIGVLEVFNRTLLSPDHEWLEFFETLAGQTALAIENAKLLDGLQKSNLDLVNSYDATIEGWSKALDLRDRETEGHTQRVTDLTLNMAKQFGFSEEQLVHLRRGALLHDIGKMGIPDAILSKPGILTAEERKIIEKHPRYAYEMLENIEYLQPALEIPHLHHERWDGSGYPYGLKGKEIPLAARMFAVIDVYDALTSDRPYRPAWSLDKTIAYIREESGRQFDPDVVEVFLQQLEREQQDDNHSSG